MRTIKRLYKISVYNEEAKVILERLTRISDNSIVNFINNIKSEDSNICTASSDNKINFIITKYNLIREENSSVINKKSAIIINISLADIKAEELTTRYKFNKVKEELVNILKGD